MVDTVAWLIEAGQLREEVDALRRIVRHFDSSLDYWMKRANVPGFDGLEDKAEEVALAFNRDPTVIAAYRAAMEAPGTATTTEGEPHG